jgi:AcrR family transcriptional regulator
MQVKKIQLKKAIMDAARHEFLNHGYNGANLRTIAKLAGCSLSNLYNYFDSKDDLFRSLLTERMEEIRRGLALAKQIRPPAGKYIQSLEDERKHHRVVIDYIDAYRDDLKLIFLKSQGSSVEDFSEYVIEQYQDMWDNYVLYIKENFPGKPGYGISEFFIHNISSSYLNSVMEFLIHNISHEEMRIFSDEMTLYSYYGFVGLMDH